jgi:hypothetical protein
VNQGVTLTIGPAVTVKFDSGKALQVDGQLIATGTEVEPIVFTSNQPIPAPGDWANILFSDNSVDATYDTAGNYVSGSIVQYCTVEYAGSGSYTPALKMSGSQPFIDHCSISKNAGAGIGASGGSLKVTSSDINHNGGAGIVCDYSRVVVSGSKIDANSNYGGQGGGICASLASEALITGNTITNNTAGSGGGIWIQPTGVHEADPRFTVSQNLIAHNSATGSGGGIAVDWEPIVISKNNISANSASVGGGICDSSVITSCTITGNSITGNSASDGGGIKVSYAAGEITYNTISGNMTGGGVGGQGGTGHHNNICGNAPYDVYSTGGAGHHSDYTNNWWGTTDGPTIQSHIYDWFDDASLRIVDYVPYLTSEVDLTPPTTPLVTDDGASTSNNIQLHVTWTSSDPDSGVSEYQYAVGTSAGGTDVVGWTSTGTASEVTKTGLNLTWGTTYYFAVKAKNGSGIWSDIGKSDGTTVSDSTPPTTPLVTDDGDYTSNNAQLHASWSAPDPESGIAEYQYAIGTTSGGTDVAAWTSVGTNTEVTKTGLSLTVGNTYYFAVKAMNGQDLWSEVGVSDGVAIQAGSDGDGHISPTTSDGGKLPFWVWIIVGVAVVLVLGVGAYLIGRRRVAKP